MAATLASLLASMGLAFAAGLLSFLSPCVLPLLPMVLGGVAAAGRSGLIALVAGLVATFVAVGLFVATIGFALGIDADAIRTGSAVLLAGFGLLLLSGRLQRAFAAGTGGISRSGNAFADRLERLRGPDAGRLSMLLGNLAFGVALGAIWSPCVGPTLGAASLLAAQGRDLGQVTATMAAFAVGAVVPLLAIGTLGRAALQRWRGRLAAAGTAGRGLLGAGALAVALLILTGADHRIESALVTASPAWLTDLTTRF